jgi:uncharacterized protein
MASLPEEDITFACQECGKSITFPAYCAGHVEVCPECGRYVDVPRQSETPSPAETRAELPKVLDPAARTTAQLWFEVSAVLCLAYLPWLSGALVAVFTARTTSLSSVDDRLYIIVEALQVSMPLLAIMALSRDRWSQFGIVRPKWITDIILGCVIYLVGVLFDNYVVCRLPLSILKMPRPLHFVDRLPPEGILEYLLLLISCIASGFAQELIYRGYLIPRFERLLRSTWIAVLVTTVLFASFHVYQGTVASIGIGALGLVYAIAFCLLRRIWPICVAHTLSLIVFCFHLIR